MLRRGICRDRSGREFGGSAKSALTIKHSPGTNEESDALGELVLSVPEREMKSLAKSDRIGRNQREIKRERAKRPTNHRLAEHGLADTDEETADVKASRVLGCSLGSRGNGPDERADGDGGRGEDGLGEEGSGDGEGNVGDEEAREGQGVLRITAVEDLLLEPLEAGAT